MCTSVVPCCRARNILELILLLSGHKGLTHIYKRRSGWLTSININELEGKAETYWIATLCFDPNNTRHHKGL